MENAVIYARYSSDKQTEQSIEGQLRICTAYAEQNNFNIVHHYIDRAMSGTNDRRPEFQQMISDSARKQFKYIIVYKFDRFARNMYDSAIYEHKLEQSGVKVLSATEQVGDGNESLIVKAVLRAMAEMYSRQLSDNVKRGMKESALKANSTGGTIPFGYRLDGKKLVLDERTAPFAKHIFMEYAAGKAKMDILRELDREGCRKSNGKALTMQNITYILSNVKYTGVFKFKDIEVEDGCPALVSKETFDRCKERAERERRKYGKSAQEVDYLLVGKLYCGYCKKPMIGDSGTSRNGDKHHYYTCYTRKSRRRTGETCRKKSERKDFLEWYVVQQVKEYILDNRRIEIIADAVVKKFKELFESSGEDVILKRLRSIDHEVDDAVDALLKTKNPAAIDKINARLEKLQAERENAEIELAKFRITKNVIPDREDLIEWLKSFQGDALDPEYQKKMIDTFINAIYLYDDKVVICFNLKGGKQVSGIEELEHSDELDECSSSLLNGSPLYKLSEHAELYVISGLLACVVKR